MSVRVFLCLCCFVGVLVECLWVNRVCGSLNGVKGVDSSVVMWNLGRIAFVIGFMW